jgi:hypothetical protein
MIKALGSDESVIVLPMMVVESLLSKTSQYGRVLLGLDWLPSPEIERVPELPLPAII